MNNVVLISTHVIEEDNSIFSKEGGIYSSTFAEYFCNAYSLKKECCDETKSQPTPKEILESAAPFLEKDQDTLKIWAKRIKNHERSVVIKEIKEYLENNYTPELSDLSDLFKKIESFFDIENSKKEKTSPFSEEEAREIKISTSRTLYDVATLYKYKSDTECEKYQEYAVYGVIQLAKPDKKNEKGWDWVSTLEKEVREQHRDVKRIILLLHDRDLDEYCGKKFQCIEYKEEGTCLAIFQHPDIEVSSFFSGKLSPKEVFDNFDAMLSVLSKMRECNKKNNLAEQYNNL